MSDPRSSNCRRINRRDLLSGEYGEPWHLLPARAARWIIKVIETERDHAVAAWKPGYHRNKIAEGWASTLKVAHLIADKIENRSARIQTSTRAVGDTIGMSQSTAARKIRQICELGLITRYREHRVRFLSRTFYNPELDVVVRMPGRWEGEAAIYELATITHGHDPSRDSHTSPPPDLLSHNP